MKQGRMQMQFVSNPNSAYYKSATFGKVLNYIADNARRCDLKEVRSTRLTPHIRQDDAQNLRQL